MVRRLGGTRFDVRRVTPNLKLYQLENQPTEPNKIINLLQDFSIIKNLTPPIIEKYRTYY